MKAMQKREAALWAVSQINRCSLKVYYYTNNQQNNYDFTCIYPQDFVPL